jgi:hypothetical protein
VSRNLFVICDGCELNQEDVPFWELTFARTVSFEDSEESTILSMDLCVDCQVVVQKAIDRALRRVLPREAHSRAEDE